MNWKKAPLTITKSSGPTTVPGIIHPSGHFAIETGNTRVTHLPTGLLISPPGFTFRQAKTFAEKLAAMPFDWATLTTNDGQKVNGKPFREVIWDTVAEIQENPS